MAKPVISADKCGKGVLYKSAREAYQVEQTILNSKPRYVRPPLLQSGNTELFSIDVGGYDE